ncbi:CopG family transcriptional regulator [Kitasatospora sp. NPDC085895]|uniref:CopG family transcriptional regulator n=1 Tax=Kitasatospora sp. NPDC085895 TaxID=3155057 RepID=UPI00344C256B
MTEQTTGRPPEGGGRPQHAPGPQEDRREADLRRAEIRRLGAKYAECHAELLRRLGE